VAVGRLADAVERSLVQVEDSIEMAKLLSETTAASAASHPAVVFQKLDRRWRPARPSS